MPHMSGYQRIGGQHGGEGGDGQRNDPGVAETVCSRGNDGGLCAVCCTCPGVIVLLLVTLAHLVSKMSRYLLSVVARPCAQDIHFGDQACMLNDMVASALNDTAIPTLDEADCSSSIDETA